MSEAGEYPTPISEAERYWEARWRDEKAENERLKKACREQNDLRDPNDRASLEGARRVSADQPRGCMTDDDETKAKRFEAALEYLILAATRPRGEGATEREVLAVMEAQCDLLRRKLRDPRDVPFDPGPGS